MLTTTNSKIKDFIKIYFGTFISLIIGFLKSFVVAKLLGPTQFGLWKIIELVQTYGPILNLGIGNGVNREIPYWKAKEEATCVENITNTGFYSLVFTNIVCVILFYLVGSIYQDKLTRFAVQISGLILAFSQLYWFQMVLQYSNKQFSKASIFLIINAFVSLLLTILLVYQYKIYGQLIALTITPLIMLLIIQISLKTNYRFNYDRKVFKRIVSIGFPIMLVGILHAVVYSIDRILILHYFDLTSLGYYGLGIMLLTFLSAVPDSVSKIIYPRINEYVGRYENAIDMDEIVIYPAIALTIFMPIIISVAIIILPYFVDLFLPQYREGIFAAQVLIIGLGVNGVNILHAIMKQKLYLFLQIFAVIFNVLLAFIFIKSGFGLPGIALASTLSIIFYRVLPSVVSLYFMKKNVRYIYRFTGFIVIFPITISVLTLLFAKYFNNYLLLYIVMLTIMLTGFALLWKYSYRRDKNIFKYVLQVITSKDNFNHIVK